jgi:hypothetical protein
VLTAHPFSTDSLDSEGNHILSLDVIKILASHKCSCKNVQQFAFGTYFLHNSYSYGYMNFFLSYVQRTEILILLRFLFLKLSC